LDNVKRISGHGVTDGVAALRAGPLEGLTQMARLSKRQAAKHTEACELLKKDVLSYDDKLFVLEHWQESAHHMNGVAGAFFTPFGLARELVVETSAANCSVVDLCAGIGALSFAIAQSYRENEMPRFTCVEINPDYLAVGKKIVPEANWILASVFDLPADLKGFDYAISNPPFGAIVGSAKSSRYSGASFEYKVLDIARDIADDGVFILPQGSCPFKYSGLRSFERVKNEKYEKFSEQTGIELEMNCGIDTVSSADNQWHGVTVVTEIVLVDFKAARERSSPAAIEIPISIPVIPEMSFDSGLLWGDALEEAA
jgi:predicted RNA methylase